VSLTSILNLPKVREATRPLLKKPGQPRLALRVPPSENPQRVGAALDYAVRFGLAARGWASAKATIAEQAIDRMPKYTDNDGILEEARSRIARALEVLRALQPDAPLSSDAAAACLNLAGMDVVYRAGRMDQVRQEATKAEIRDMVALWEIVPWSSFRSTIRLLLNPTFREGSTLVGGADADLIVDGCLVDIKTRKDNTLDLHTLRQLVGYSVLARRFGVEDSPEPYGGVPLTEVGVYFARAGVLQTYSLHHIIGEADMDKFIEVLLGASSSRPAASLPVRKPRWTARVAEAHSDPGRHARSEGAAAIAAHIQAEAKARREERSGVAEAWVPPSNALAVAPACEERPHLPFTPVEEVPVGTPAEPRWDAMFQRALVGVLQTLGLVFRR
jgi:hypothetical protein